MFSSWGCNFLAGLLNLLIRRLFDLISWSMWTCWAAKVLNLLVWKSTLSRTGLFTLTAFFLESRAMDLKILATRSSLMICFLALRLWLRFYNNFSNLGTLSAVIEPYWRFSSASMVPYVNSPCEAWSLLCRSLPSVEVSSTKCFWLHWLSVSILKCKCIK